MAQDVNVSVPAFSSDPSQSAEIPLHSIEVPSSQENTAFLESPSSQEAKIPGWSTEAKPEAPQGLDPSTPVEIEELPQEEPEFLEQLVMVDPETVSLKPQKSEKSAPSPSLPKKAQDENTFVILQGLDKITARVFTFKARVGEVIQFENLRIIPHFCKKSAPEEEPETVVFLEIHEKTYDKGSRQIFSGWMFASSPTSSALEHPIYDVWVKGSVIKKPDAPAPTVEENIESPTKKEEKASEEKTDTQKEPSSKT